MPLNLNIRKKRGAPRTLQKLCKNYFVSHQKMKYEEKHSACCPHFISTLNKPKWMYQHAMRIIQLSPGDAYQLMTSLVYILWFAFPCRRKGVFNWGRCLLQLQAKSYNFWNSLFFLISNKKRNYKWLHARVIFWLCLYLN